VVVTSLSPTVETASSTSIVTVSLASVAGASFFSSDEPLATTCWSALLAALVLRDFFSPAALPSSLGVASFLTVRLRGDAILRAGVPEVLAGDADRSSRRRVGDGGGRVAAAGGSVGFDSSCSFLWKRG